VLGTSTRTSSSTHKRDFLRHRAKFDVGRLLAFSLWAAQRRQVVPGRGEWPDLKISSG